MEEINCKKRKSEKGAITLFVLVTMMFFLIVLFLIYAAQTDKITNQKEQIDEIQRQYNIDENLEEIYQEAKENESTNINGGNRITFKKSTENWTNQDIIVTVEYGDNLTGDKTITCTGTEGVDYTIGEDGTVTVKTNQTITVTAMDEVGNEVIKAITISNIDKILPTVSLSPNGGIYVMPSEGNAMIKTTLIAQDGGGSGLSGLQYAWSNSNTEEPIEWTDFTNGSGISKTDCIEGSYYLWTKVTDVAGNRAEEVKVSNAFTVGANTDETNVITLIPNTDEWTNQDVIVTVAYGDNLTENRTITCTGIEGVDYTIGEDGTVTVKTNGQIITVTATDKAGNEVTKAITISNIDKILPTVSLSPNGGNYVMPSEGNATIKTTLTAQDEGGSNLSTLQYAWSNSNEEEPIEWIEFVNGSEIIKTDCTEGNYYLWTKVTDVAGNRAEEVKVSNAFMVDTNTVEANSIVLTPSTEGWTNQDVIVTVSYGENLTENRKAGIESANIENATQLTVSENGTVYAEATDMAGNKVTKTLTISNIDKILPTVTLSTNGGNYVMPSEGNATIKTTLTAQDEGGSNLSTLQYAWSNSNTQEPSEWSDFTNDSEISKTDCVEGNYYLWTKVTDLAGNRAEEVKVSDAFIVGSSTDEANTITLTPNTEEWTNQDVTVTVKYGDNLTGNKTITCTGTEGIDYIIEEDGAVTVKTNNQTITVTATDEAGNEVTKAITISNIDKILPTVSLSPNGGNYVMPSEGNATIKTTLTAQDEGGSNLSTLQYAWSNSNEEEPIEWIEFTNDSEISKADCIEGSYYLWTKVTDVAGNRAENVKVSNAFIVGANTDKANTITLTPNTEEWTNQDVTVKVEYGDNLTGNKTITCTGTEGVDYTIEEDGTITVKTNGQIITVTASDIAGNTVTKTITISNIDKTLPTVTVSPNGGNYVMPSEGNATIKTTLTAQDEGGSNLSTLQYTWSNSNTKEPSEWTEFVNGSEIIKTDCTEGSYYLWTKVTDVAGNRAEEVKVSDAFIVGLSTDEANTITLTPNTEEWTNQDVTVKVEYGDNLTGNKTITCTGTEGVDYTIGEDGIVTVKTNGQTITVTATDIAGNTVTKTITISNIDKILPTVNLSPNGGTYIMPSEGNATIKTALTAQDEGESGLNILQYAWSNSKDEEPSEWTDFTNDSEISKIDCTEGNYYLWTKVTDAAGNRAEEIKISNAFTISRSTDIANSITLLPSIEEWTNQDVIVTVTYGENLTEGRKAGVGSANIENATQVTVSENATVYAEAMDAVGNKITKTLIISNIDKTLPTVNLSPNGGNYIMPTEGNATIKTILTANDEGGSGLSDLQYAWSDSKEEEPTEWTEFTNDSEISKIDCVEGSYYLWTKVTDVAGNRAEEIRVSNAFMVNTNTVEANSIVLTPSIGGWTNQDVIVTVSYGENLTQNRKAGIGSANVENATQVTVSENGTVYAEATDMAGNKVIKTLTISNIDKILPTVNLSQNGGNYTMPSEGNATIKITLTAQDEGGSNLSTLQYAWSNSNEEEPIEWIEFTNDSEISKIDCTQGSYYLWTKVTDVAGNRAEEIKVSNAFIVGASTDAANSITLLPNTKGWTNQDVTVTIEYGNNLTGNKTITCTGTEGIDYTIGEDGTVTVKTNNQTITVTATDEAGNEVTKAITISNIDKILPTVSLSPNGGNYTMPSEGNATIKTTLTAQDEGGSGLSNLQYAWSNSNEEEPIEWIEFTNDSEIRKIDCTQGSYYLWTKVTDVAGNRAEEVKVSNAFIVGANTDEANTITLTPNTEEWTNKDVTVKVEYGDNLTGDKTITCTGTEGVDYTIGEDGTITVKTNEQMITVTATDAAGNTVTKTITITNIDKILPTVTLSKNGGTYVMPSEGNATIKTTLTAQDEGGSGLSNLQYAWSNSDTEEPTEWTDFTNDSEISKADCAEGSYYLWTKVTDVAGNRAEEVKVSDAFIVGSSTDEANTITLTPNTEEWTNQDVTVTVEFGDNLTGDKTITCTGTEGVDYTIGEDGTINVKTNGQTITVTATDKAGNTVTKSITISNIDKSLPTVSLSPNGGTYVMPSEGNATIKTTLTAQDEGGSGLSNLQYAWSNSNTKEPSEWTEFVNGSEIIKTDCTEGSYYLWAKVTDVAGNRAEEVKVSDAFIVGANTDEANTITLTPNTKEWTNQDVTVKVEYGDNLTGNKTITCTGTEGVDYTIGEDGTVTVKTNGQTITVTATDIAGNTVTKTITISNIDKILPTVSLSPNGGNYTMPSEGNATIKTTLTAQDEGGSNLSTLQYAWSNSNEEEPIEWIEFTNDSEISKIDCTQGSYYLWTRVTDVAENRAEEVKVSNAFIVGANTDEANTITLTPNTKEWTNQDVTVKVEYGDNLTGDKTITCTGTEGVDYTIGEDGTITVKTNEQMITVAATDAAGNTVTKTITINNIDKILPTVSLSPNGGNYTMPSEGNATIKTTLTAQDEGGSNLSTLQYAWSNSNEEEPIEWIEFTNDSEISKIDCTQGSYYLWTRVTDVAGNRAENVKVSDAFAVGANTDEANTIKLTPNTEEWTNQDVIVTVTYGENLTQNRKAGVGSANIENAMQVTVPENGTVYAEATDIAGNKVTNTVNISNIDKILPTVNLSPNGGTYVMPSEGNATIKTTLTAQDEGGSGLSNLQYAWSNNKEEEPSEWMDFTNDSEISKTDCVEGSYYLWTKVTDVAGNRAENVKVSSAFIVSENTTEANSITLIPSAESWTNQDVIVTIIYGENLTQNRKAGIGSANIENATQVTLSENGTVYAEATDMAGNKVTKTITISIIDKEEPIIEIGTNGGNYIVVSGNTTTNITTTLTATDTGGSGLNTLQYQLTTQTSMPADDDSNWKTFINDDTVIEEKSGGTYYLYTKVTDKAGNRATTIQKSDAYIVKYQVKYDVNGGIGEFAEQEKEQGVDLTLSTTEPTKEGYIFEGWATSSSATTATYQAGETYSVNESITLYAVWTPNPMVSILTNPSDQTVVAGSTATFVVEAVGNGTLSYQWYYNTLNSTSDGTAITDGTGTSSTYSVDTSTSMNGRYYYCIVTSTVSTSTATATSSTALLTVEEANYSITNAGVTTYYNTLEDAHAAATSGGTITVLQDVTDSSSVTISKTITLDTNGYTVTRTNAIYVEDSSITFTISGTGTITSSNYVIYNQGAGTVTISGATIAGTGASVYYTIYNPTGGTINLTSGNITSQNSYGIYNIGGTIIISEGTISGSSYGVYNLGTITMSGGTVLGTYGIENYGTDAVTTITGGTVTGTTYGIYNIEGILTVGSLTETLSKTNPSISGGTYGIYGPSGTFNFYNGILKGTTAGSYGTISGMRSDYTLTTGTEGDYSTTYYDSITQNYSITKASVTAYYATLADAHAAATSGGSSTNGGTITVLQNVTDASSVTISKTLTLNTNGYTITRTSAIYVANGSITFTVSGSGTITSSSYGIYNNGAGTVTISGATIAGTGTSSYYTIRNATGGTINITSGSITSQSSRGIYNSSGTVTMSGGTITASSGYGIYNTGSAATTTVTGGTITGSSYGIYNTTSATLTVGSSTATLSITNPSISGGTYGVYKSSGTFNFYNGILKGTTAGSYGIISGMRSDYTLTTGTEGNYSTTYYASITANYSITKASVTTYYETLADAHAAASSGGTITVLQNVTDESSVTISKTVTLNTNGYTITRTSAIYVEDSSITFTVSGSGTITSSSYGIYNNGAGTVTISGATIAGTGTSSYYTIYNTSGGTINITSGSITSQSSRGIYNSSGTVTMSGGTITASSGYGIYNYGSAATTTVTGGTITGSSYGIYNTTSATLTVGSSTATLSTTNPSISGGTYGVYKSSGTFNFYNGILKGTTAGSYGTISGMRSDYTLTTGTEGNYSTTYYASITANYSITKASVTTYYETLADAHAAATSGGSSTNGGTITVLQNVTDASSVTISKTLTLNTNGYTITRTSAIYVEDSSITFTVSGSGTITSSSYGIYNNGAGTVTISGATIAGTGTSSYYTIRNATGGTINITSGSITSQSSRGIYNSSGTVTMSGGTITASSGYGIYNTGGTVTISEGTVEGSSYGIYNYGSAATTTVTGGTITGSTYGIYNYSSATLTVGSSTATLSITNPSISGGTYGVYKSSGTFNFYNGILKGTTAGSYGTISGMRSDYTLTGGTEGDYYTTYYASITANYSITRASVTTYYATLADAHAAATSGGSSTNGGTITVLQNVTDASSVTISKTVTLNTNGYTITRTGAIYVADSSITFTVSGSGTITSSSYGIYNNGAGTVTISGATIAGTGTSSYYTIRNATGGTIKVTSGSITSQSSRGIYNSSGTVTMSGGTITASSGYGIYNTGGTVTISGGTITASSSYGIYNTGGTMTISAGTITGSSYGIYNYGSAATTTVTGGTITGSTYGIYNYSSATLTVGSSTATLSTTNPSISGGTYGVYRSSGTFNFYNGILKGTTAGSYGTISGMRSDYTLTTGTSGSYFTTYYASITANYSITKASVTTYYATLATAHTAATSGGSSTNGGTITIVQNVTDSSTVTISKNLTLDTNGKTLTRSSVINVSSGYSFTVSGSGTIDLTNSEGNLLYNSGTTTILAGSFKRSNLIESSESLIANHGTMQISGGSFSSNGHTIGNDTTSTLTIGDSTTTSSISIETSSSTANSSAVYNVTGTTKIYSGVTITNVTGHAILNSENEGAIVEITGATVNGKVANYSTFRIYDGTTINRKNMDDIGILNSGNMSIEGSSTKLVGGTSSRGFFSNSGNVYHKGGTISATTGYAVYNTGTWYAQGGTISGATYGI